MDDDGNNQSPRYLDDGVQIRGGIKIVELYIRNVSSVITPFSDDS